MRTCAWIVASALVAMSWGCGGGGAARQDLDATVAGQDDGGSAPEDGGDSADAGTPEDGALACPTSGFEPNDSQAAAAVLTPGTCEGLALGASDQDWYRVTVPANRMVTVSIDFDDKDGDLDLLAFTGNGTFLGARYMEQSYDGYYRSNETSSESLSVMAGSEGPATYLFEVRGYRGATNTYQLTVTQSAFQDGADCAAIPALSSRCGDLHEFPFPDPDDGFIGAGYDFDTSDWFDAFFVFANYRWLQLKVILAVRDAIHAVQQRFPGTNALSLGDMCQRNGRTPGWDIGNLRHPDGSHDDGLAIDLAYYQTRPTNELQWICDADVDTYTGVEELCPAGLQHVVDVPRTAFFLMTLAQHADFDVVGIDPVVRTALLTEGRRMAEVEAWFTMATYSNLAGRVASGPGWDYHFDHMHVWFN